MKYKTVSASLLVSAILAMSTVAKANEVNSDETFKDRVGKTENQKVLSLDDLMAGNLIDLEGDVLNEVKDQVDILLSKKSVVAEISNNIYGVITSFGDDGEFIYEEILRELGFGSDSTMVSPGNVSGAALSSDYEFFDGCHAACHGACHSACHGSRGWR